MQWLAWNYLTISYVFFFFLISTIGSCNFVVFVIFFGLCFVTLNIRNEFLYFHFYFSIELSLLFGYINFWKKKNMSNEKKLLVITVDSGFFFSFVFSNAFDFYSQTMHIIWFVYNMIRRFNFFFAFSVSFFKKNSSFQFQCIWTFLASLL